jgi:hypothetical protein
LIEPTLNMNDMEKDLMKRATLRSSLPIKTVDIRC